MRKLEVCYVPWLGGPTPTSSSDARIPEEAMKPIPKGLVIGLLGGWC